MSKNAYLPMFAAGLSGWLSGSSWARPPGEAEWRTEAGTPGTCPDVTHHISHCQAQVQVQVTLARILSSSGPGPGQVKGEGQS